MKIKGLITSKSISAVTFFNILGIVVLKGINFITISIFTKMLGTANYGIYTLYHSWVLFFTILVGLQVGGTIGVFRIYIDKEKYSGYLSSILTLATCSFIAITATCFIFINPISIFMQLNKIVVLLILLESFGSFCFAISKFTYFKEGYKTFAVSVAVAFLGATLSIIFINAITDENTRYLGRVYTNCFDWLVFYIKFLIKGKVLFSKEYWSFCIPICLPLIIHLLLNLVLTQCDKIMLQHFTDNIDLVGIYGFGFTLSSILTVIWRALNNTWMVFYYDYVKERQVDVIKEKTKNYIRIFTILKVGFVMLQPEVVKLCTSKDFWGSIDLIPLMAFSAFMVFAYSFPVNFELYNKKIKAIAAGTSGVAIFNIILKLFMIPRWGLYGSAIATSLSYVLLFVFIK